MMQGSDLGKTVKIRREGMKKKGMMFQIITDSGGYSRLSSSWNFQSAEEDSHEMLSYTDMDSHQRCAGSEGKGRWYKEGIAP